MANAVQRVIEVVFAGKDRLSGVANRLSGDLGSFGDSVGNVAGTVGDIADSILTAEAAILGLGAAHGISSGFSRRPVCRHSDSRQPQYVGVCLTSNASCAKEIQNNGFAHILRCSLGQGMTGTQSI